MKLSDVLVGTAALVILRLFVAKRGLRASLRSSTIAAVVGAVVYPLVVYVSTGLVAATKFPNKDGWPSVEFGFARFGRSAPADSVPPGVMLGILVMTCADLLKQRSKS